MDFYESIPDVGAKTAVEIGCHRGESAYIASGYVKALWCVDPWNPDIGLHEPGDRCIGDNEYYQFLERMKTQHSLVAIMRMPSLQAAQCVCDGSFDIVYIDGMHDYGNVWQDIVAWYPKVVVGGYIGGHDYNGHPDHEGLCKAVNTLLGEPDSVFRDSSWIFKKTETLELRTTNGTL